MLKPAVKRQQTSLHWMWLAKFTRWQEALASAPDLHSHMHMSSKHYVTSEYEFLNLVTYKSQATNWFAVFSLSSYMSAFQSLG